MRVKKYGGAPSTKRTKITVFAAVFLTMCAYFVFGSEPKVDQEAYLPLGLVWLLAALLVGTIGFLMAIYDIGAAPKGYRAPKVMFMLSVPLIGLSGLFLANAVFMPENFKSETANNPTNQIIAASAQDSSIVQDPEIVQLLQSVGVKGDYSNLSMRWADDMLAECNWAEAGGCYKSDGVMHELIMKRGIERSYMKVSAAHEYLHYVWYKNELDNDTRLTSYLIDFYGKNPSFQKRINGHYVDNGALKPTEFFSYGCTEVQDARLGSYIAAKCNEYIDTSKLPALY